MCGYCCQGETTVSLDADDIKRLTAFLNIPYPEVQEKYLRITGNVIQMKIKDGHCIFFDQGCTVHPGKPWRCSEWPLHPSLLTDIANFQAIQASCPGITRDLDYDAFCNRLQVMRHNTRKGQ
jgi:Fe-S-cluster containining protein